MRKTTLIIGASTNPERYSYKAAQKLLEKGHGIFLVGKKEEMLFKEKIRTTIPLNKKINTVTLYINPSIQKNYYQDIIALKPKRVIFNPGTENTEFSSLLKKENIDVIDACTLVMLSNGLY